MLVDPQLVFDVTDSLEGRLFYLERSADNDLKMTYVSQPFPALGIVFLPETPPSAYINNICNAVMKLAKGRGYRWEDKLKKKSKKFRKNPTLPDAEAPLMEEICRLARYFDPSEFQDILTSANHTLFKNRATIH